MIKFTVEEVNFMCVFKNKARLELIENVVQLLKHIEENDMKELAMQIVNKLQNMSDEEYSEQIFEPAEEYKEPLFLSE